MRNKRIFIIMFIIICWIEGQSQMVVSKIAKSHLSTTPSGKMVDDSWEDFENRGEYTIEDIIENIFSIQERLEEHDFSSLMLNRANGIKLIGNKVRKNDGELQLDLINDIIRDFDLNGKWITELHDFVKVIDDYYALKFIVEGCAIDDAWGAMRHNLISETIDSPIDYKRYKAILELDNDDLKNKYFAGFNRVFQHNGCTEGLFNLKPIFEKSLAEGEIKDKIMFCYSKYLPVRSGELAPGFVVEDIDGKQWSFEKFKNKILVIDVWATWCSGCIQRLPKYIELNEKYKNDSRIEFITVSIDKQNMRKRWEEKLVEYNLESLKNFIVTPDNKFIEDYRIVGIPRYILIDKTGEIISLFMPTSGNYLEECIEKLMNKK